MQPYINLPWLKEPRLLHNITEIYTPAQPAYKFIIPGKTMALNS